MSVNLFIAAGLFDSPWTVAIFLLAGALINWLSKRRADNAGKDQAPESDAAETNPSGTANWEESLRRMFEDKTPELPRPTALPTQTPPLIRRAPLPRPAAPPMERQAAPPLRPPPVEIVPGDELEFSEPAVRRYELSDAAHAAQAQRAGRRLQQAKTKRPILGSLRHPQTARQAFAASLVFGPPKGLEL